MILNFLKDGLAKLLYFWVLPCHSSALFSNCPCLVLAQHPAAHTCNNTCTQLAGVVWIRRVRKKTHAAMVWGVCSPVHHKLLYILRKRRLLHPPGSAHRIHNTLLHARWLSPQVLFPINQTVFELINNKSISRRREKWVSRGHRLFVRQTSAAPLQSATEQDVSFGLETWLAGYHKSKYQL